MEVGDLVTLKNWCKDSGRFATVVETPQYLDCVKIVFLDDGKIVSALIENLEVISEAG